uniref:Methyl-accepting chemotaxis protein I (Serine chemoreceptor protein) n=1 Tax=Escherichia coli TaxID=562 RepID=A0A290GH29_ECOLX|nr:Methyl-accepting chemotaxis protein I (serine chemoreceptor protein) [Escherichia coli]
MFRQSEYRTVPVSYTHLDVYKRQVDRETMLKRIKIVTSLLLVLAVFGLLQLTSGGLFFNALKNDKNLSNDRLMCADLCQTGFCLSIIENRNFPESSILYLASKGVFSFICLSAGSRKDRFNSAKFFCWDSGKTKRSFNQA